jgi:hypothetical protein
LRINNWSIYYYLIYYVVLHFTILQSRFKYGWYELTMTCSLVLLTSLRYRLITVSFNNASQTTIWEDVSTNYYNVHMICACLPIGFVIYIITETASSIIMKSNDYCLVLNLGNDSTYIIRHLHVFKSTVISSYKSNLIPYLVFIYSPIVWLNETLVDRNNTFASRYYSI